MIEKTENKIQKWGVVFVTALFSIFLFYLNYQMPLLPGDDYLYSLKIPSDGHIGQKQISSIKDLFESQYNHYFNYNYRVAPHAILQVLLTLPSLVFKVLNTLVFLLIPIVLILPFKQVLKKNLLTSYLIVLFLIWCFHFDLGRSYFWTTGSLNYTWLLLAQLYFVGKLYQNKFQEYRFRFQDAMIALLICTSNENIVLSLFIVSFLIVLIDFISKKKTDKLLLISMGILLFGGLLMMLSPSLTSRLVIDGNHFESFQSKFIEYIKRQGYYVLRFVPVLLFYLAYKKKKYSSKGLLFFFGIISISSVTMIFAPLYEPRSAIFSFMVFIMFTLSTISYYQRVNSLAVIFLGMLSVVFFIERKDLFGTLRESASKNQVILENNRNSKDTVFLNRYCEASKFSCLICDEISDDPAYMDNEPLAAFYGIHKLALNEDQSLVKRYNRFVKDLKDKKNTDLYQSRTYNKSLNDTIILNTLRSNKTENGVSYIYEFENSQMRDDYIVILRGSRKDKLRYRLLDILPQSIRMYFLDYLEHHGPIVRNGKHSFGFNHVFDNEKYKYYLASIYSKNNHTTVGLPFVVPNQ